MQEFSVTYPLTRFDSLFGTYCLTQTLTNQKKHVVLKHLIDDLFPNVTIRNEDFEATESIRVWPNGTSKRDGYQQMKKFEQWVDSLPNVHSDYPFKKYINRLQAKLPASSLRTEVFYADGIKPKDLHEWIQSQNLKPSDFQMLSKFSHELSITFKNPELATLFKLQFAELV